MSYPTYLMHYSDELCHHGIKGQKWGERRYQYEDGSLTPEGKKRYLNSDGTLNKKGEKVLKKIYSKGNYSSLNSYNERIKNRKDAIPKFERDLKDIEKNGMKSKYFRRYYDNWIDYDDYDYDKHEPDEADLKEIKTRIRDTISAAKYDIKTDNQSIKNFKSELKKYGLDDVKISDVDNEKIMQAVRDKRATKAFFKTVGLSLLLASPAYGLIIGATEAKLQRMPDRPDWYGYDFDDYDKKDKK